MIKITTSADLIYLGRRLAEFGGVWRSLAENGGDWRRLAETISRSEDSISDKNYHVRRSDFIIAELEQ